MQREISQNNPVTTLNPLKDATGVVSVDYSAQFNTLVQKVENLKNFIEKGNAESAMINYLPGLAPVMYQGQLKGTKKSLC